MKVLFVSSGNSSSHDVATFIKVQANSIARQGVAIDFFPIIGKGIIGYLKGAVQLRRFVKTSSCDLIHAHYTLSGWSAVLALTGKPIILSLMGSDAYGSYIGVNRVSFLSRFQILLTYLIQPFVKSIISKSEHINSFVYIKHKSHIIPNGIDLKTLIEVKELKKTTFDLATDKCNILFLGYKKSVRKNYKLLEKALSLINYDINVIAPYPTTHNLVFNYLNTVDLIVVPSLMEGSPNVVKEAMACNCPVVATDVGDIRWLFGNEPGHYITSFDPNDVAEKIKLALQFAKERGRTNGRQRIIELGLDSETVAKRIIEVYNSVLKDEQ